MGRSAKNIAFPKVHLLVDFRAESQLTNRQEEAKPPGQITSDNYLKLFKLAEPAIASEKPWKKARLIPVYKKTDETDTNNYRPISLLSVPSKIVESCVSDAVVRHIFQNNLVRHR